MSVIRYRLSESEMEIDDDGSYVVAEDYDRLREALRVLTAASRKEAEYNDVVRRHLWLYIERAEKVLRDAGDK